MRVTRSKSNEKNLKRKRSTNDYCISPVKELIISNKKKGNNNKGAKNDNARETQNKGKEDQDHNSHNIEEIKFENYKPLNLSTPKRNKIIDDEEQISICKDNDYNNKDINDCESDMHSTNISPDKFDVTEKLTNSYIYCREREKDYILKFMKNTEVNTLFICGQPGTGKTSLVNEVFKTCLPEIEYTFKIQINCMSVHSVKDFYEEVFKFFNKTVNLNALKNFFSGGKEIKKFEQIVSLLKSTKNLKNLISLLNIGNLGKKLTPIVLLDEVDHFYKTNDDISFFEILNLPHLSTCNMKIIMISNNPEFDKHIIPKIENRKIKIDKSVFQPYTHVEINKILTQKLQEINYIQYFEENAIRFIASKLANKSGDIRPAIEIVKRIILTNKNEFANGKKIELREVMIILKQAHFQFTETIKNLTLEQKVVITSIYFEMIQKETNLVQHDDILKQYKKIKKENFNDDICLSEFDTVIESLIDMGIIVKIKAKKKNGYKVEPKMEEIQLIFSEDERLFKLFRVSGSE